jgi:hypothetical protein
MKFMQLYYVVKQNAAAVAPLPRCSFKKSPAAAVIFLKTCRCRCCYRDRGRAAMDISVLKMVLVVHM